MHQALPNQAIAKNNMKGTTTLKKQQNTYGTYTTTRSSSIVYHMILKIR